MIVYNIIEDERQRVYQGLRILTLLFNYLGSPVVDKQYNIDNTTSKHWRKVS